MTEERLKLAQELSQIGSWELDLISNELWWSDEIYRLFEIQAYEFEATFESFLDHIHPDDRDLVNKAYSQSLIDKRPYEITHRLKLKDGSIKHVTEKCKTFYDKKGKPIKSIGTVQDITKLHLAEEKFKRLFENLGDAVYVTKIGGANKGQILEVNSAAILQTGYTKEELLNMNIIRDLQILGTGDLTTEEWEEKLNKGEAVTITEMKRRKDGTEFWTEVIVTTIDYNGERASLSINHDITDLINSEEKISKLNDELENRVIKRTEELTQEKIFSDAVINSLPGIFSLIAQDGSHVRWNKNHEEVTGFSAEEYKRMRAIDFFQGVERRKVIMVMSQIFKEGKADVEANLLTKSGKSIPYFFTGRSININNKKYLAGVGIDISEKKKAEHELQKRADEFETINKVMLDREMRVIEMKEEVNKLSKELGKDQPYPEIWKDK